ncbi:MAG: aminotransferase class V-fold PLP-dependent enzyme, partial [Gemmobacter sp.]
MPALDVDFVRSQFPAFAEPTLEGWAFFENAGGSYPCRQVVERLARFYRARKVQPYAPYPASEAGGAEMDEARARLAAMLGVATDEVSFGPSTSANTYVLAQAVRDWLGAEGGAVVVAQEHHAARQLLVRLQRHHAPVVRRRLAVEIDGGAVGEVKAVEVLAGDQRGARRRRR